jgi:hypothetical protein
MILVEVQKWFGLPIKDRLERSANGRKRSLGERLSNEGARLS